MNFSPSVYDQMTPAPQRHSPIPEYQRVSAISQPRASRKQSIYMNASDDDDDEDDEEMLGGSFGVDHDEFGGALDDSPGGGFIGTMRDHFGGGGSSIGEDAYHSDGDNEADILTGTMSQSTFSR